VAGGNRRNLELLGRSLEADGWRVLTAACMEELDRALSVPEEIGLALVDIAGFGRDIWERCESLRARGVMLLVISPRRSQAIQQESLAHGARGVLVKPLSVREVMTLVRGLLRE